MLDLGRLEVGRHEDVGRQPGDGRGGCRCSGEIAGRRAGEDLQPEVDGFGHGHRHGAILEGQRWVAAVVLDQQPLDPDRLPESGRRDEGARADRERPGRLGLDREQLQVPPDAGRAGFDRRPDQATTYDVQVVGDLEGTETARTDVARAERFGAAAGSAAEAKDPPVIGSVGQCRRCAQEFGGHGVLGSGRVGDAATAWQWRGPAETRRPFLHRRVSRVPYRAGEPARNWHLADSAPVGCRGINGPVPPPLLIELFDCG